MLGGRSDSLELEEWASRELRGYDPDHELPDYRWVGAPLCVDGFTHGAMSTGRTISVLQLPEVAHGHISALRYPSILSGSGWPVPLIANIRRRSEAHPSNGRYGGPTAYPRHQATVDMSACPAELLLSEVPEVSRSRPQALSSR